MSHMRACGVAMVAAAAIAVAAVSCGGSDETSSDPTSDSRDGGVADALLDAPASDGAPGSDGAPTSDGATDAASACGAIPSWADTATFARELHVAAGAASGGDGSSAKPFATIGAGLAAVKPGDRLVIHAGTYPGGAFAANLQGTAAQPIEITGAPGEAKPHIQGGVEGLHLTDPTYVIVSNLEVSGQSGNAINVDDGGSYATPAHHVVFRGLDVHDVATGNHDGLKMSGVEDALVVDSTFRRIGGQMVDMVGCHRVTVARCRFEDGETVGVQMKGGSADDVVTRNVFVNAGPRGVNMGGSTGLEFFRPIDAPHEAARIVVSANVFVGGDTPFAYVGCDACVAAHNTILRPNRWAARILQETVGARFVPSRNGKFVDNLVVVGPGISGETVNVGPNTDAASFTFSNDLWFHTANAAWRPSLPVTETAPVYADPKLVALDATPPDARLQAESPALGKGLAMKDVVPSDHDGRCWATPESIGAFEAP